MRKLVAHGATLSCTAGLSPGTLSVVDPLRRASRMMVPVATVDDHVPLVNVAPFGMCQATANPQVAAATAAANGVLTPVPCQPVIAAPWTSGPTRLDIDGRQVLTDDARCQCQWAGAISVVEPACDVEVE